MKTFRLLGSALVLSLYALVGSSSAAQEPIDKVKELYAAAAYEDALAVVTGVPEETRTPQLEQYRAFCLIALGQKDRAEEAIEALLEHDPMYVLDSAETSPRVIEAFVETRSRVLPSLTRDLYVQAKAALERKDRAAAVRGFERVLQIIERHPTADSNFEDLKVLASGFLDLSKTLQDSAAPDSAPTVATNGNAAEPPKVTLPIETTRAVALKQEMPAWSTSDPFSRRLEFTGTLRLMVGVDGRVQSAELVRPVHPIYDPLLLRATENWLYEPARQNGVPVPSEVVIEIRLRPQED